MSGSQCHDNESSLQLLLQSLFIKELDVDDIYGMVTRILQFSLSLPFYVIKMLKETFPIL